jgi:hypothetical protein
LGSTEPVNYRYATFPGSEEIVDTEIAMCIVQEECNNRYHYSWNNSYYYDALVAQAGVSQEGGLRK